MGWIGIVSIDGNLFSNGVPGRKEEAKRRVEGLLETILKLPPDKHGLVRFHGCKVNWTNGSISDQKPYCVNLSRVGIITTNIMQYGKKPR